ncbi:MAG: SDR family oxidoreductase [Anaerolineales bacterium]
MNLLILGGTVFLGRHLVQAALDANHQVTLFNRGKTNPDLFPDVEKLRGDRNGDLGSLESGRWDAVIDTCGYEPSAVEKTSTLLSDNAGHYTFISTISVYGDPTRSDLDETAPTAELTKSEGVEVSNETYGPLKAACERTVQAQFDGPALIVRPGLIAGPHDPTERFAYWPRRMARGGEVLAPGKPGRPVQLIDVRDLADWIVQSVETDLEGVFNATGPAKELTMESMLKTCAKMADSEVTLTWIPDEFLLEAGVAPFTGLPLWLPEGHNGLMEIDNEKALSEGLDFRPLADTARETYEWDQERGGRIHRGPGIDPARELALLQVWETQHVER